MAKKIKKHVEPNEEERKAADEQAEEEASRAAAGIQDEFQARGFELVEWVQERQGLVLGILGAIALGGAALGVYTVVDNSRNTDASVALAEALETYEAPVVAETSETSSPTDGPSFKTATERATAARALFEKTATEHDGTGAGAIAHLYAGHAAMKLADHEGAANHYQAFIQEIDKDDPLRFAGHTGLAAALDAQGDRKGAIATLEALVSLPHKVEEDAALLELGRLHQAEGDIQAARAALERLVRDFPESSLKPRADELLASLGEAPAATAAPSGQPVTEQPTP